jgi:integrase
MENRTMPTFRDLFLGAVPKYRRHKASGQAVVTLAGRDHYLGPFGSKASKAEYDRLVAEWLAAGRPATSDAPLDRAVAEIMAAYMRFASAYYKRTQEVDAIKYSLRPLKRLFGTTRAADFGPLRLKAVREEMIRSGLARKTINQRVGRIVRMFRWASENELIPPSLYHGLTAVSGLRFGRSEARETEPVKPVPDAFVDAVLPLVSPPVRAMIELQRLTGMRPGEVVIMRACDLDTTGPVWIYRPSRHKTQHHGHGRNVYLGPQAQETIKPFLRPSLEAYLFSPRDSDAWHRAKKSAARKTPLCFGNRPGTNRRDKPKRRLGEYVCVHG